MHQRILQQLSTAAFASVLLKSNVLVLFSGFKPIYILSAVLAFDKAKSVIWPF